jgi:hypothetical protein
MPTDSVGLRGLHDTVEAAVVHPMPDDADAARIDQVLLSFSKHASKCLIGHHLGWVPIDEGSHGTATPPLSSLDIPSPGETPA